MPSNKKGRSTRAPAPLELSGTLHEQQLARVLAASRASAVEDAQLAKALELSLAGAAGIQEQASAFVHVPPASISSPSIEGADLARALERSRVLASEEEALACALHLSSLEDVGAAPAFPLLSACVECIPPTCSAEVDGAGELASSAPSVSLVEHVLKATMAGDTRRLSLSWPISADDAEILTAVHAAVVDGFVLDGQSAYTVTYPDEDGDQCTLVVSTVQDFIGMAKGRILRVLINSQGPLDCGAVGGAHRTCPIDRSPSLLTGEPAAELAEFTISTPRCVAPTSHDVGLEIGKADENEDWAFVADAAADM